MNVIKVTKIDKFYRVSTEDEISQDLLKRVFFDFQGYPYIWISLEEAFQESINLLESVNSLQNHKVEFLEPLNIYHLGVSQWIRHRKIDKERDFPIRQSTLKLNMISHDDNYVWVSVVAKDLEEARLIRRKLSKLIIEYLWKIPFNNFDDIKKIIDECASD